MGIEDIIWPEYPKPPQVPWKQGYDRNSRLEYPGATEENVAKYEKDYAEYLSACSELDKIRSKSIAELYKLLKNVGLVDKYYTKTGRMRIKTLTHTLTDAIAPFIPKSATNRGCYTSDVKTWLYRQKEEVKKKKESEKKDALVIEATQWLLSKGKVFGQDFDHTDALSVANEIAADELIAEIRKEGEWHDFSGDDECSNCKGWDGESHRCDCGNRRVSWEVDDYFHSFKKPSVRAVAY